MESVEQILEQFPKTTEGLSADYKSFVFQPNRLSVNSRQNLDVQNGFNYAYNLNASYFNQFSCPLRTPILGLKSLELIRATIPMATLNIPNDETVFYYFKLNNEGVLFDYAPDFDVTIANVKMVRLLPSNAYTPNTYLTPSTYGWNRTFTSYQDLVDELNKAAVADPDSVALTAAGLYSSGDITFFYDELQNKIGFRGNNYLTGGRPNFYYAVVGWRDVLLTAAQALLKTTIAVRYAALNLGYSAAPVESNGQYTLARRMGFLWTGIPVGSSGLETDIINTFYDNVFPQVAYNPSSLPWVPRINCYADSFADLVYSANLFLYCDVVGGGSQDTNIDERLLAVIPMNTTTLGVNFGESKIPCELSKISGEIYSLNFIMRTDVAKPFLLPVNAYINLELKLNY
jgi:hypothetical protein